MGRMAALANEQKLTTFSEFDLPKTAARFPSLEAGCLFWI